MTGLQGSGSKLSVEQLCRLAEVNRAAFYRRWQDHAPRQEETAMRDRVQLLCLGNRHYGHRRIAALLRREGWQVNHKRVLRLMREDNLLCLRKPIFRPATTDSRHSWRIWPNLARHLEPMEANQLWVADITYVRLAEAFVYLAVILDGFSRKVVGWAMAGSSARRAGARRAGHGVGTAHGHTGRAGPSLRPRHPIRLRRLYRPIGGSRHSAQHEPDRVPL